jgi:hypothetical protein
MPIKELEELGAAGGSRARASLEIGAILRVRREVIPFLERRQARIRPRRKKIGARLAYDHGSPLW